MIGRLVQSLRLGMNFVYAIIYADDVELARLLLLRIGLMRYSWMSISQPTRPTIGTMSGHAGYQTGAR